MTHVPSGDRLQRPPGIPTDAVLAILDQRGESVRGEVRVGKTTIAKIAWSLEGKVQHLMPFDEAARPHGIEQEYADDGKMVWCAKWAHGVMHGPAVQLDDAGAPLIVTLFVNGRGADIWASCGNITEYRELDNGVPHGLMRWGDMTHPAEEGYYRHGRKHGVFRHWTNGKLDDGFPRFFIDDRALSLSEYEAARAHDASLPAYQIDDDEHGRTVPSAAIEAVRRAQALRGDFQLAEFLEQLENE